MSFTKRVEQEELDQIHWRSSSKQKVLAKMCHDKISLKEKNKEKIHRI